MLKAWEKALGAPENNAASPNAVAPAWSTDCHWGQRYLAAMSTKQILALSTVAGVLYLAFAFGLMAAFPRAEVGYDTAVAGRVTGIFLRKDRHTFFLNGQRTPRYDFDGFRRGPANGTQTLPPLAGPSLGQYLHCGDFIRKSARTAELTVQRGDSLTHWTCMP